MKKYSDIKKQLLKNKKIKKEYVLLDPEFKVIEKIIELRTEGKISQKQLAEKIGTKQPAVSRFEKGLANPTVSFLSRIASAFEKKLVIEFK